MSTYPDHLMARYYDPQLGRFLQTDPLLDGDPQNSPYTYVRNNPLRLIDPTGMAFTDSGVGGFGVGAVGRGFSQIGGRIREQSFSSLASSARSFGAELGQGVANVGQLMGMVVYVRNLQWHSRTHEVSRVSRAVP